jgi:hypothetical protein
VRIECGFALRTSHETESQGLKSGRMGQNCENLRKVLSPKILGDKLRLGLFQDVGLNVADIRRQLLRGQPRDHMH